MVLHELLTVRDSDDGAAEFLALAIEATLNVDGDGRGTFIETGILGLVVVDARDVHALFFTAREDVDPILGGIPASFTLEQVGKLSILQNNEKIVISDALALHIRKLIRIDDLIAESTNGEVGTLRDEHDILEGRTRDNTLLGGPQLVQDTEHRRFAASVGTHDDSVYELRHLKVDRLDERQVLIGSHNIDILELDSGSIVNTSSSIKVSAIHVGEELQQFRDTRGITSDLSDTFVQQDDLTSGLSQIDENLSVANVTTSDRRSVASFIIISN